MSAYSHVTRLQMLDKGKGNSGGNQAKYAPISGSQGTPSIIYSDFNDPVAPAESVLSSGSHRPNPKELKDFDMRRAKSQDFLRAPEDPSFRGSTKNLQHSYAPSLRSLKPASNMGQRIASKASLVSMSRSLGASKASIASQKSTIQQEYHDIKFWWIFLFIFNLFGTSAAQGPADIPATPDPLLVWKIISGTGFALVVMVIFYLVLRRIFKNNGKICFMTKSIPRNEIYLIPINTSEK